MASIEKLIEPYVYNTTGELTIVFQYKFKIQLNQTIKMIYMIHMYKKIT